ncbi:MAG: TolC family protein, partial [Proteobacteria bacterium]
MTGVQLLDVAGRRPKDSVTQDRDMARRHFREAARGFALAAITISILTLVPGRASAAGLRLEEALRLAMEHNERAAQAKLRIDAAEGSVIRARAAFLPSLTVGGTASASDQRADRGQDTWSTSGNASLSQPLIAPSSWPTYSQQKKLQRAEESGSLQDKRTLGFDTARAYIQGIAAQQSLAAAKSRLDRARANYDVARARAEAQLASTNDVTRASLDLASASQSAATQEGALQRSYLTLTFLVGREVTGPLETPDGLTSTTALLAQGVDQLMKQVPDRRADLRELRARADAASVSATEPYYRMFPTLNAQAAVRATPGQPTGASLTESTLTFNMNWPVFDGGSRYGDLRQREAQAQTAKLAAKLQERNAQITVRQALASFDAAKSAYDFAVTAVQSADRSIEETQVLYQQGLEGR